MAFALPLPSFPIVLSLATALLLPAPAGAEEPRSPPVVELFTSQGCSSCPPADALLGELAARKDVIALSLHVDYWDYIGWRDPFASPEMTARQRSYARHLGSATVYTPQMVIDGRAEVIGSRRAEVLAALEAAASRPQPLSLSIEDRRLLLSRGTAPPKGAELWLVGFDQSKETAIERGENAGRRLVYHNVAHSWRSLGTWRGEAMELPLDLSAERAAGRSGVVVLVQEGDGGPILAAPRKDFN